MIPQEGNDGAEGQGKVHGEGKVFQLPAIDPLLQKIPEEIDVPRFSEKPFPAQAFYRLISA